MECGGGNQSSSAGNWECGDPRRYCCLRFRVLETGAGRKGRSWACSSFPCSFWAPFTSVALSCFHASFSLRLGLPFSSPYRAFSLSRIRPFDFFLRGIPRSRETRWTTGHPGFCRHRPCRICAETRLRGGIAVHRRESCLRRCCGCRQSYDGASVPHVLQTGLGNCQITRRAPRHPDDRLENLACLHLAHATRVPLTPFVGHDSRKLN